MAKTNLIAFQDEAPPDATRAPVEPTASNSERWIGVGRAPLRRARHLNVDEVLARSLPKLSGAAPGRKILTN